MAGFEITSHGNERIKRLVRLRERRHRDEEGVFLVEGSRLVQRALAAGLKPLEVYEDGSIGDLRVADSVLVEPSVLAKASYRNTSQGVIAVFAQFEHPLRDITPSDPALLIVTENVEKPGNLGAMMRTASAAGADAVVTVGRGTDIFNPNVVRSSTGALFTLPVVSTDLGSLGSWLDEREVRLVATSPVASESIWQTDLRVPCALMVGAEDSGLSRGALDLADVIVGIPMFSSVVDSLNTSVSLALIAYEAVRQRSRTV